MSQFLQIPVTREEQIQIEEICINTGQSLSEYLIGLHRAYAKAMFPAENKIEEWMPKKDFIKQKKKKIE